VATHNITECVTWLTGYALTVIEIRFLNTNELADFYFCKVLKLNAWI